MPSLNHFASLLTRTNEVAAYEFCIQAAPGHESVRGHIGQRCGKPLVHICIDIYMLNDREFGQLIESRHRCSHAGVRVSHHSLAFAGFFFDSVFLLTLGFGESVSVAFANSATCAFTVVT